MDEDSDDRPDVPGHRLLHVIGSGAASVVWAGTDAAGRTVAVKVPRAQPDPVARREAELERHVLMAVHHEHLVPLRDVVPLADGRVAHVFDQIVGSTLAALVASRGHLRPGEVVTVVSPLAEAVATLHAAGGTHCDISPANVMLTADGRPLLMDLGAARLAGNSAGAVVGTPGFVAPEVRSGQPPTEASDVFSLGALAWFCLTGNGAPDTFLRLSAETVTSHLGPEFAEIIGRCIDPEPEVRPSSAALPALLYDAAPKEPVEVVIGADVASALTHRIRAEAAASGAYDASRTREEPRPWFRRVHVEPRRWSRAAAVVAVVAGLAVALGWLAHLGLVPGTSRAAGPAAAVAGQVAPVAQAPTPTPSAAAPRSGVPEARALLQDLTDRRVLALVDRRTAALDAVHRPNSPSWQADAKVIEALQRGQQRYQGLRMTVREAEYLSRSGSAAVVRARIAIGAYAVIDGAGRAIPKSAEDGERLDFHLVRAGASWLIESISDPRPS